MSNSAHYNFPWAMMFFGNKAVAFISHHIDFDQRKRPSEMSAYLCPESILYIRSIVGRRRGCQGVPRRLAIMRKTATA